MHFLRVEEKGSLLPLLGNMTGPGALSGLALISFSRYLVVAQLEDPNENLGQEH